MALTTPSTVHLAELFSEDMPASENPSDDFFPQLVDKTRQAVRNFRDMIVFTEEIKIKFQPSPIEPLKAFRNLLGHHVGIKLFEQRLWNYLHHDIRRPHIPRLNEIVQSLVNPCEVTTNRLFKGVAPRIIMTTGFWFGAYHDEMA